MRTKTEFHYSRNGNNGGWAVYKKTASEAFWTFVTYAPTKQKADQIRASIRSA